MTQPGRDARLFGLGFGRALALVALGALTVRIAYVLIERRDFEPGGDAFFYHAGANLLADGKGFISPFFYATGRHVPAAEHPPLYLMFLAVPSALGMQSVLTHLLWSCVLGTGTVVLVGLLGREVAGARVGVIAATLAAVYPNVWAPDGMLQAESLAMFFAALAVLLAYRYRRAPSWARLALVGIACGAGALARSELLLLAPLLIVPLALSTREISRGQRWQWLGASLVTTGLLIAPWAAYNTSRFEHPILLSAQIDPLLASANCDSVYNGSFAGYYDILCARDIYLREGLGPDDDQSEEGVVFRREALEYVRGHLDQLPAVVGVRLVRIVGLYHPSLYVRMDSYVEGRDLWVSWAAFCSFYVVALLAIAGAIILRRTRRAPLWPLLAPVVVVVVTVVVTYASTRFRSIAEPMLVVLAAVAIDGAFRHLRAGVTPRTGTGRSSAPRSP